MMSTIVSLLSEMSNFKSLFTDVAIDFSIQTMKAITEHEAALTEMSSAIDGVFVEDFVQLLGNLLDFTAAKATPIERRMLQDDSVDADA